METREVEYRIGRVQTPIEDFTATLKLTNQLLEKLLQERTNHHNEEDSDD